MLLFALGFINDLFNFFPSQPKYVNVDDRFNRYVDINSKSRDWNSGSEIYNFTELWIDPYKNYEEKIPMQIDCKHNVYRTAPNKEYQTSDGIKKTGPNSNVWAMLSKESKYKDLICK
jgi:hypothetical protein